MNEPLLGWLFGNFFRWEKSQNRLLISLGEFEAVGVPTIIFLFATYFGVTSFVEEKPHLSLFSFPALSTSIWAYFHGRRRLVISSELRTIELKSGAKVKEQLFIPNLPLEIQKARIWDSQTDGPSYFSTYILMADNKRLLSMRSHARILQLAEEIRSMGIPVNEVPNTVRANL